jgi:hypothetical protein
MWAQIIEQVQFWSYSYKRLKYMMHLHVVEEIAEAKILRYLCG